MKKIAALAVVLAALVVVGAAVAITYGKADNGRHPNVAAIVRLRTSENQYRVLCSGSLVTSRYVLTASHCTSFVESLGQSDIWVTFDDQFTQESKLIHGTMITNPSYNQRQSDPGDIALIRLDRPMNGITPVELPEAGLLDAMKKAGTLKGAQFTSVGYGILEPEMGPGGISHDFPMERWTAVGTFSTLDTVWLRISQNQATGDGGTCSGDSGGPQFLGDSNLQVSITITGDLECFATNVDYRLDTAPARAFLSQYIAVP